MVLLLSVAPCFGQTMLSGGDMAGTIKKSGSPYRVTGDIRVPKDSTLIIEEGVYLDFDSAKVVRIDGCLKAMGTESNPITMTCSDSLLGWLGLMFVDNPDEDTSMLNYTKIEYIGIPRSILQSPYFPDAKHSTGNRYAPCAILAYNTAPIRVSNCWFRRNWRCTEAELADVEIHNSEYFENITEFGKYNNGNEGNIINSHYSCIGNYYRENNVGGWYVGDNLTLKDPGVIKDCLFKTGWIPLGLGNTKTDVINCIWEGTKCTALQLTGGTQSTIENCVFNGTYGDCIFGGDVRANGGASETTFLNCVFKNKSDYITSATFESSAALFQNCVFDNNIYGIYYDPGSSQGRLLNCFFVNNDESINAAKDVDIINCAFINNTNRHKDKFNEAILDSVSGALRSTGGKFSVYNSVFWNNTDYFGRTNNMTIWGNQFNHRFYNSFFQGGSSSIHRYQYVSYAFTGTIQDCITTAPQLVDTGNGDYHVKVNCSGFPSGFNKGYQSPISMYYQGKTYTDILSVLNTDMDGNPRIYDDTTDIGPYEIQALANRIDVIDSISNQTLCEGSDGAIWGSANSVGLLHEWQTSDDGIDWKFYNNKAEPITISNAQKTDSGKYYRIKWANSCGLRKTSDDAQLSVVTPKDIELTTDSDTINQTTATSIKATAGFKSYNWSTGDKSASITIEGKNLGLGTHTIIVTAIDANGCEAVDSIEITVLDKSTVVDIKRNEIIIYPNPATKFITVEMSSDYTYEIVLPNGQNVQKGSGSQDEPINISTLKEGQLYIVRVESEAGSYFGRFLIDNR